MTIHLSPGQWFLMVLVVAVLAAFNGVLGLSILVRPAAEPKEVRQIGSVLCIDALMLATLVWLAFSTLG